MENVYRRTLKEIGKMEYIHPADRAHFLELAGVPACLPLLHRMVTKIRVQNREIEKKEMDRAEKLISRLKLAKNYI